MSDLDLPLLPSAEQIRRRKFATVRRGYDPDQVQDYLNQVALQVEALEGEVREQRLTSSKSAAESSTPTAPARATPMAAPSVADAEAAYEQISKRLATVMRAADDEAQKLIEQARAEATKLVEEARAEAESVRVDAHSTVEEARTRSAAELQKAQEEADRVLGGLEQRRESLLGQMHEMQSRLLAVAQNLEIPDDEPSTPGGAHSSHPEDAVVVGETLDAQASPVPAPVPSGKPEGAEDAVDPRYEDMWATSTPRPVDIPDLSSLDIDFDDEPE